MIGDPMTVWTWTPGMSWRRVLDAAPFEQAAAELAGLPTGTSGAAFAAALDVNPNRETADDLAELAELTHGPILDTIGRSKHDH